MDTLGERIRQAREDAGLLVKELAKLVGVDPNTVSRWESGSREPRRVTLKKIAAVTNQPFSFFLVEPPPLDPSNLPGYQPSAGFLLLPLLGRVTAGPGGSAEETVLGYHHIEASWIPPGQEDACFLLDVRGESMTDAGIRDGDRVLVCKTVPLRDGDVAVVDVDGEAMVKRVYLRNSAILLVSEHQDFTPIEVPKARIIGRVMASWRYH